MGLRLRSCHSSTQTAGEPGIGGWLRRNAQFGSVLSALSIEGVLATMSIEDATDGAIFAAYLEQVLLPVLRERKPDTVLVMDNLRPHKTPEVRQCSTSQAFPIAICPPTARTSARSNLLGPR